MHKSKNNIKKNKIFKLYDSKNITYYVKYKSKIIVIKFKYVVILYTNLINSLEFHLSSFYDIHILYDPLTRTQNRNTVFFRTSINNIHD